MGKYRRQFGDRICEIRIKMQRAGINAQAHIVRVGEPPPETDEEMPVLPNEEAILEGMVQYLRNEYGDEPEGKE